MFRFLRSDRGFLTWDSIVMLASVALIAFVVLHLVGQKTGPGYGSTSLERAMHQAAND